MIADTLINTFVEAHKEETIQLLKTLTAIPASTGEEKRRAEFIMDWLSSHGIKDVISDYAGNVICPCPCRKNGDLLVVSAHMDTVFAEKDVREVTEHDGKLYAPGIGDDTANLVNMLMTIRFLQEQDDEREASRGILFVANVGEEGLGNLKGSKAIYESYGDRIKAWISFDLYYNGLYNRAVGSNRYRVTVRTQGGHSFGDFGNANAIAVLADIIGKLYQQEVPADAKTTYNVGKITGGTSVNSIAQEAGMLYEFRSESDSCLKIMEAYFEKVIREHQTPDVQLEVELLGIRPGHGKPDEEKEEKLTACCMAAIRKYYDGEIKILSASTDCNIPLSKGIPAVTFGTILGGGMHTVGEWIEKDSLIPGQKLAIYAVRMASLL